METVQAGSDSVTAWWRWLIWLHKKQVMLCKTLLSHNWNVMAALPVVSTTGYVTIQESAITKQILTLIIVHYKKVKTGTVQ
jgi:hypothetical protein